MLVEECDTLCEESSAPAIQPEASGALHARAIRGGSILIACKWAAQIVSWTVTLAVARLLSPEDYGVVAAAGVLLGLSDLFAEAGVGRALVQKPGITPRDYDRAFTLSLVLSLGCYAMLFASAPAAARFLRTPELTTVLPVMGVVILLVPYRTVPQGILDRNLQLKSQGVLFLISTGLQAATVFGLALAGAGYWSLVLGATLARLFECVSLAAVTGWRPRVVADLHGSRALLSYGLWISGGSFLWYFYSNSDFAVVGRLEGPVVLGYYSLAFQLMSLPAQKITANINQVAFPVFCRLQGDRAKVREWFLRLSVLMNAVVLPTLLGGALVAADGMQTLFGAKWLPAVLPFRILCVVGLLSVISSSLVSLLNALGRPDVNFRYTAACACVFPPAFAIAGQMYGVIGVCLAWVFVYLLAVGLMLAATRSITGLGLGDYLAAQAPALIAGTIMAAAVLLVGQQFAGRAPAPLRLMLEVATGVATYAGVLWIVAQDTIVADLRTFRRTLRGDLAG
ncbi:MAG: lipopolysaccharide biosynthesis protein [Isosphaeraceae bacterium]